MLKNYFKIAWRNLVRNRAYSLINIIGLTIGITSCLLIFLYVVDELSYDKFHKHSDRIYRVVQSTSLSGSASIPAYGAAQLAEYPEVEDFVRVYPTEETVLFDDRDPVQERDVYYADVPFFQVFSFSLKRGDKATVLSDPNSVVLTPETAQRYFGDKNPIGRTLTLRGGKELQVTGITDDIPSNTHLQFDMLISHSTLGEAKGFDNQGFAYLLLNDAAAEKQLEAKFSQLTEDSNEAIMQKIGYFIEDLQFALQPVTNIHLYPELGVQPESDPRYIYIFGAVGLFILLIACINYMNLATARSSQRAREVGLRKVSGASRFQLIGQFLGESILFTAIAFLLALGLADLLSHLFSELTGKELTLQTIFNGPIAGFLILGILLVGSISGLYPAVMLSRHAPVKILRGHGGNSIDAGGKGLRQGLVAFQFVISIVLIASTLVIQGQLDYIQQKRLGYDTEQVITLPMLQSPDSDSSIDSETVRQELASVAGVEKVSRAFGAPTGYLTSEVDYNRQSIQVVQLPVDYGYVETMGMELVAGRSFSRDHSTDESRGIIINETAARIFDLEDKVGEPIDVDLGHQNPILTGIVKDFHSASLHHQIKPTVLVIRPYFHRSYVVRLASGSLPGVLDRLKTTWSSFGFQYPFNYRFVDDTVQSLYTSEQRLSWIFQGFAALAIIIACLGLLGLSAYTAERRTKEIGIRKVLGATIGNIVGLLSKDFIKLVILGFVIAVPIASYAMNQWLADFAYRIEIGPGIFAVAGGAALFIALATVSWQSVRAALANPVDSLRSE